MFIHYWSIFSATSLCLVVSSFAKSEDFTGNILRYQKRQIEMIDSLLSHNEDLAIECSRSTIAVNKGKSEKLLDRSFLARKGNLALSIKSLSTGAVYAYLCNDRYCALLSANTRKSGALQSWSEIADARTIPFTMPHFSKVDPMWIKHVQRLEMFGMYFSFGGPVFVSQFPEWNQAQLSTDVADVSGTSWKEVSFPNWLPNKSSLKLTVDREGCVCKAEAQLPNVQSTLKVEEFIVIDGVRVPKKISVFDTGIEDPNRSWSSTFSWSECSTDEARVEKEQFYSSHYGLPEPSLDILPPQPRNYLFFYSLAAFVILVIIGVFFLARKYAN